VQYVEKLPYRKKENGREDKNELKLGKKYVRMRSGYEYLGIMFQEVFWKILFFRNMEVSAW
jgi:hypothetical protein